MALTPTTTRLAIEAASALARRNGTRVLSIEVVTADGRTWAIDPKVSGCFRLFEVDHDHERGPDEHHAVDGDEWHLSDLLDYLDAVGQRKTKPAT